jgi:hypothetical protein
MISGRGNNVFFSRCVQINSSPNQPLAHWAPRPVSKGRHDVGRGEGNKPPLFSANLRMFAVVHLLPCKPAWCETQLNTRTYSPLSYKRDCYSESSYAAWLYFAHLTPSPKSVAINVSPLLGIEILHTAAVNLSTSIS